MMSESEAWLQKREEAFLHQHGASGASREIEGGAEHEAAAPISFVESALLDEDDVVDSDCSSKATGSNCDHLSEVLDVSSVLASPSDVNNYAGCDVEQSDSSVSGCHRLVFVGAAAIRLLTFRRFFLEAGATSAGSCSRSFGVLAHCVGAASLPRVRIGFGVKSAEQIRESFVVHA